MQLKGEQSSFTCHFSVSNEAENVSKYCLAVNSARHLCIKKYRNTKFYFAESDTIKMKLKFPAAAIHGIPRVN